MGFGSGILFAVIVMVLLHFLPTDDTDKSFFKRSGMYLHTDYKTGKQYLGKGNSLIPRLDENGFHIRIKK